MELEVVRDTKISTELVKMYSPVVYQQVNTCSERKFSLLDLLTSIQVAFMTEGEVNAKLPLLVEHPTLNFSVRQNDNFWFIYYLLYHPFDWSNSRSTICKVLDSHRHDTEAMLVRVLKKDKLVDLITVCHQVFLGKRNSNLWVTVESCGHGIRPYSKRALSGNYIAYKVFDLFDLNILSAEQLSDLSKVLGKYSFENQTDSRLVGSPSGTLVNKPGDIFHHPNKVFKVFEEKGWIV